jgi:hypothetical protein
LDVMSSNFGGWVDKFEIIPQPIVHAGAHFAEERFEYLDKGFQPVYWIEAIPQIAKVCEENLLDFKGNHVICAVLADQSNVEVSIYLAGSEDSSSSILKPHLIKASHPEVYVSGELKLQSTTLDSLYADGFLGSHEAYGLILDLQGAEGKALSGGVNFLSRVDFIVSEVSIRELYKNGVQFDDLTRFLGEHGFSLLASEVNKTTGWGEALYLKTSTKLKHQASGSESVFILSGTFSLFTWIRGAMIRMHFPKWVIDRFKRH